VGDELLGALPACLPYMLYPTTPNCVSWMSLTWEPESLPGFIAVIEYYSTHSPLFMQNALKINGLRIHATLLADCSWMHEVTYMHLYCSVLVTHREQ